jgi:D-glycero-alpha-D-manno-heptose-7-phosphate kinase
MKEAVLTGHLDEIGELLDFGWEHKKAMAGSITNLAIDEIYQTAKRAGASGGKISGAGGGGFMIAYCPGNTRYAVAEALAKTGVAVSRFEFTPTGLTTWRTK